MIEEVDQRLKDWAGTVIKDTPVSLAAPSASDTGRGVGLYLMDLAHAPPPRTVKRPPLRISLRYLVTTWAEQPEEAHGLLGQLVFAAMDSAEFEVDLDLVPVSVWRAFGVAPRPSFVLRVPLQRERPEPEVKLVRGPLEVETSPVQSLQGVVLGPQEVPLVGARVELPALRLSTRTDSKGRFHFSTVPAGPSAKLLRITAKGRELSVKTEGDAGREPMVIQFDPTGG